MVGIFVGHVLERGDEQVLFGFEVEVDDAARDSFAPSATLARVVSE